MKTDLFQSCGHCWVFQICWHIECSTFTASSFRIWKSSTGIPSPPLAFLVVMLSKALLTSHSRMSGSRWVITPSWYPSHEDLFCTVLCILAISSWSLQLLLGLYRFCPLLFFSLKDQKSVSIKSKIWAFWRTFSLGCFFFLFVIDFPASLHVPWLFVENYSVK